MRREERGRGEEGRRRSKSRDLSQEKGPNGTWTQHERERIKSTPI